MHSRKLLKDNWHFVSRSDSIKIELKMLPKTLILGSFKIEISIFRPGNVNDFLLNKDEVNIVAFSENCKKCFGTHPN